MLSSSKMSQLFNMVVRYFSRVTRERAITIIIGGQTLAEAY